ncbi:MAG: septum formation initiator family protein [Parcubacteria group bacterium]|nr:septum formation initiator family protein [Parcubacteria group bacterium]
MSKTEKSKIKLGKNLLLVVAVIVLLVVLVFFAKQNMRINNKREKLQVELDSLEQRMLELTKEKENLQGTIIQSDEQEYLEEVAREELNLKRVGESVVAFPVVEEQEETEEQDMEQQNLWQKIMDKIR